MAELVDDPFESCLEEMQIRIKSGLQQPVFIDNELGSNKLDYA